MAKLEPYDNKKTKWLGLWYHKDMYAFTSPALDLADLRKFKGAVRLIVKKNKFYNNGENGRPNYVFMLCDSKCEKYIPFEVEEIQEGWEKQYQTGEGERLYTHDEVRQVISGVIRDVHCGYDEGDLIPEDYV